MFDLPTRPTTVLAVDDEAFNLDLFQLAFDEMETVTVLRAENGRLALDMLEADVAPDVILLDLAMPVMNGFETLVVLKGDARWRQIPVIVVTANAEERNSAFTMGANDFLAKPVDVVELQLRTLNYARIKEFNDLLEESNSVLDATVAVRTQELREALEKARQTEREIAYRLGRAAEFRDVDTGAHIRRMSRYSARLAELYGLSPEQVELILYAAPLHDIGKVGIPDSVLLKPAKLEEHEYETMRMHPVIGAQILDDSDGYDLIDAGRIIARQHHEKYDGTGYPDGLAGEEIHIYGRLVAVADVFDALTSRRVYKPAIPIGRVMEMMEQEKGRHFDPGIVDLLLANIDEFLEIKSRFPDTVGELSSTLETTGEPV